MDFCSSDPPAAAACCCSSSSVADDDDDDDIVDGTVAVAVDAAFVCLGCCKVEEEEDDVEDNDDEEEEAVEDAGEVEAAAHVTIVDVAVVVVCWYLQAPHIFRINTIMAKKTTRTIAQRIAAVFRSRTALIKKNSCTRCNA